MTEKKILSERCKMCILTWQSWGSREPFCFYSFALGRYVDQRIEFYICNSIYKTKTKAQSTGFFASGSSEKRGISFMSSLFVYVCHSLTINCEGILACGRGPRSRGQRHQWTKLQRRLGQRRDLRNVIWPFFREICFIVLVKVFWGRGEICEMSFWGWFWCFFFVW